MIMLEQDQKITKENLIDFYKRFEEAKQSIGNIDKATAGAVTATGKVKYKYADLPSILNAIKEKTFAKDIAVNQSLLDGILITTILDLKTGYSEEKVRIHIEKSAIIGGSAVQELGSGITYLRRYSLLIALDVAPEDAPDDDDGNGSGKGNKYDQKNLNSYKKSEVENLRMAINEKYKLCDNSIKDSQGLTAKHRIGLLSPHENLKKQFESGGCNIEYTKHLINMAMALDIDVGQFIKTTPEVK